MPEAIISPEAIDKTCQAAVEIRKIPFNLDCEAALLGAALVDNSIAEAHSGRLRPEHFYNPLHQRMWQVMMKFLANGKMFTPITLKPVFELDPAMIELGGPGYMMKLAADPAAMMDHEDFADQILELAQRRRLMTALAESIGNICNTDYAEDYLDTDEVVAQIDAKIWDDEDFQRSEPLSAKSAVQRVIDRQHRMNEGGVVEGAECLTVPDINKIIGPLSPGHFTLIGARPSIGKTALAMSVAMGCAFNGHATDYFHNEMTPDDIGMRHVTDLSFAMGQRLALQDVRLGKLTGEGMRWLENVQAKAEALPLRFHDIRDKDIDYIRGLIRRSAGKYRKAGRKLEVVVIDYLQKVEARDGSGKEIEHSIPKIKKISKVLQRLAAEEELHVIALCQLGRQVDSRPDHKPHLSDLKESGDLEQDADNVLLLWRPEVHLAENEPPKGAAESKEARAHEEWYVEMETWREKMEIIGAKVRHGAKKSRRVRFYGANSAVRASTFNPDISNGDLFEDLDDGDDGIDFSKLQVPRR